MANWKVKINDEDREIIKGINTGNIDLGDIARDDKVVDVEYSDKKREALDAIDAKDTGDSTTPAPKGEEEHEIADKAPETPEETPGGTDSAPGGEGSSGDDSDQRAPSGQESKVRNLPKNHGKTIVQPYEFIADGPKYLTNMEARSTDKWAENKDIYNKFKKRLKKIQNEAIEEWTYGYYSGDRIDLIEYTKGELKCFDVNDTPERTTAELNVIIAVDGSGSMGWGGAHGTKAYQVSGATHAIVKALEDARISYSLMLYSDEVALAAVDQKGRTNASNVLACEFDGWSGNNEALALDYADRIAQQNKDKTNVFFLINDGGVADIRDEVKALRNRKKSPLKTFCIGYGDDFDGQYATEVFGEEFVYTTSSKTFADTLGNIIQKELDLATRSQH